MTSREPARSRFMQSVLTPTYMRGFYLKGMERVSPNATIPFVRIAAAAVSTFAAVCLTLFLLLGDPARAPYVAVPLLLCCLSVATLAVVFMVGSHDGSMLTAVANLAAFKAGERARSRRGLGLSTLGVKSVGRDGTLTFEDGDVGAVYSVRGVLSMATLPQQAERVREVRRAYYVARGATSQEMRLTTVAPNELASQTRDWRRLAVAARNGSGAGDAWRAAYADVQTEFLDGLRRAGRQLTLRQTVVLRDCDLSSLRKARTNFERAVAAGMYDRARLVTDPDEVADRFAGYVMAQGKEV